jgi:hypothetical protein
MPLCTPKPKKPPKKDSSKPAVATHPLPDKEEDLNLTTAKNNGAFSD